MNLPEEYISFIKEKSNKAGSIDFEKLAEEYEPELKNLDFLPIDKLKIKKTKIHKPNQEGYYSVKCVYLTDNVKGSIVWFPKWKAFGCLDEENCFVCKDVSWSQLSKDTYKYLIGRWEWEEGEEFEVDLANEECPFVLYKKPEAETEKNKAYYFEKAAKSIKFGRYKKAIDHYNDYHKKCEIKSPVESAEVYGKIANVNLSYLKDFNTAINFYGKAILFNPMEVSYYKDRSTAYYARKEYDKALIDLDKSLEMEPDSYFSNYRKGLTLYYGLQDKKGIDWWKKCLSLPRVEADVFTNLIEYYITQNNPKEALPVFEEWEERNPPLIAPRLGRQNEVIVQYLQAITFKLLGEDEKAADMEYEFKRNMGNLIRDGYGWSFTNIRDWAEGIDNKEIKDFILRITNDFDDHID